jgi:rhamnose utilization protein RhaD (predicted bifunctional aldolase and dehydrogenase)
MDIRELVKISRFYGKNPEYLMAGGGNTSLKDEKYIYVKASGAELASVSENDFVKLRRDALDKIWHKEYPDDAELREKMALEDLMNSRERGEARRPSVESLFHALMPQKYIVHTHPAIVNGMICSKNGARIAKKLFNERCIWIPSVNPGYTLAKLARSELMKLKKINKPVADIIFLGNHGMFVGAETIKEIKDMHNLIMKTLKGHIFYEPDFSPVNVGRKEVKNITSLIKGYPDFGDKHIKFENNNEISKTVKNRVLFKKVKSAYTPDHIVYAGPEILFLENTVTLSKDIERYKKRNDCSPKIIAVKNTGVFAIGDSENKSHTVMSFFLDTLKISIYAENFGGYKFMKKEQIDFIKSWEVEKFRAEVAAGR